MITNLMRQVLLRFAIGVGIILSTISITLPAFAQPQITYMLPDAGAPGMAVYVEFYASVDATLNNTNFSAQDALHLNNPGSGIFIQFVNPSDSNKIILGPIVTSWQGRLLSTIFFINPDIQPNSANWKDLEQQYRIPIRVVNPNGSSNVDTFYIVKPSTVGDLRSSNNTVLGNNIGFRSRRGTVVVDSLILGSKTYSASMIDPDGDANNGNQAFLPLTILSAGPVIGNGSSSIISVDAVKQDAGVGGGGGGGSFCDVTGTNAPGGNGYTGGGCGGTSVPNTYNSYGTGSGARISSTGASMTGLLGGQTLAHECAGGGTGHAFGQSGIGCANRVNCRDEGKYGGASGGQDLNAGAGGGYGTDGGTSVPPYYYGKANGNMMIVPLAGGSGGSSGNPNAIFSCGGYGGGGGGAINIVAPIIRQFSISANGANGGNGSPAGGGGSGGGVVVCSHFVLNNVTISAIGGNQSTSQQGGTGRVRFDSPLATGLTSTPLIGYNGPTLDTLTILQPNITLKGFGSIGKKINVYARAEFGRWSLVGTSTVDAGGQWSLAISYNSPGNYAYFVAAQEVPTFSTSSFTAEPPFALSPVAAIRAKIVRISELETDSERDLGTVSCLNGGVKRDTFTIRNKGTAAAHLTGASFLGGSEGFSIIEPNPVNGATIPANGSLRVIVQFQQQPNKFGLRQDKVLFTTDDVNTPSLGVNLKVTVDSVGVVLITRDGNQINGIDFQKVCRFSGQSFGFAFRNISKSTVQILSIGTVNTADYTLSPLSKSSVAPGDTVNFTITARPGTPGDFSTTLNVKIDLCNLTIPFNVFARCVETDLVGIGATSGSGDVDFFDVQIGKTQTKRLVVVNQGNDTADVKNLVSPQPPFSLTPVPPYTARPLAPGDSVVVDVSFTPTATNSYVDSAVFISQFLPPSCPDTVKFTLRGRGTRSSIVPTKSLMDYDTVYSCSHKRDSVWLKNTGNITAKVYAPAQITGGDGTLFRIVQQPSADSTTLQPAGDSLLYIVEFVPDTSKSSGTKSTVLEIRTFDDSSRIVRVGISAYYYKLSLRITPLPLIVSDVPINSGAQFQVDAKNENNVVLCINDVKAQDESVVLPQLKALSIPGLATRNLQFKITPKTLAVIYDTVTIYYNCPCSDSIKLPIKATPTNNLLTISPDSIDFGNVQPCLTNSQRLKIRNVDPAQPAVVHSVTIVGKDSALFSTSFKAGTIGGGVNPEETVSFNPAGTRKGEKTALLITSYTINGENILDTVKLRGYRDVPIDIDVASMDFGTIRQGQTRQQAFTTTNSGLRSITVSFGFMPSGMQTFKIVGAQQVNIVGGGSETIPLEFGKDTTGEFFDTLYVRFGKDIQFTCLDSIPLPLHGIIVPGLGYRVWLDSATVVSPTDRDVRIGIWGKLDTSNVSLPKGQFQTTLDFPYDMFHPKDINAKNHSGRFTNFATPAGGRYLVTLTVDTTLSPISQDSVLLAEIIGDALLGDTECDSIRINSFDWINTGLKPTTWNNKGEGDNKLCTIICKEGNDRLLGSNKALALKISPSPVNDGSRTVTMEATSLESGVHSIIMLNATGSEVMRLDFNSSVGQTHSFTQQLDAVADGLYYIILRSPTQQRTQPLIIVR